MDRVAASAWPPASRAAPSAKSSRLFRLIIFPALASPVFCTIFSRRTPAGPAGSDPAAGLLRANRCLSALLGPNCAQKRTLMAAQNENTRLDGQRRQEG